jgi:hypothetical protein
MERTTFWGEFFAFNHRNVGELPWRNVPLENTVKLALALSVRTKDLFDSLR